MHPLINIAIKAALSASKIIVRALDRPDTIGVSQKARNDFVTEIDKQSEAEIFRIIHRAFPQHAILGEESGSSETGDANEYLWIVDPLDGTTNYIHGHPHFCISIAVRHKDKLEHGVIYDPLRKELFHATRGAGAYLDNRRIRVSKKVTIDGALIASGFGNGRLQYLPNHIKILHQMLPLAAGIRRSGSAALDFAYVAAGRLDGFWEYNLASWDMAAGAVLVKEAGGLVSDMEGGENFLETGNVIAGNPKILKATLQLINDACN